MDKKILDEKAEIDEKAVEKSLRPQKLNEFIGQEKLKEQLQIFSCFQKNLQLLF